MDGGLADGVRAGAAREDDGRGGVARHWVRGGRPDGGVHEARDPGVPGVREPRAQLGEALPEPEGQGL